MMGFADFLVKMDIYKSMPLIYGIEGGTKITVGIVGKILIGVEGVGALANHFQQDPSHRNDATNSNRGSSSQTETTDSVIDMDGREVAVLSITAVLARPMVIGATAGAAVGDIALGVAGA